MNVYLLVLMWAVDITMGIFGTKAILNWGGGGLLGMTHHLEAWAQTPTAHPRSTTTYTTLIVSG